MNYNAPLSQKIQKEYNTLVKEISHLPQSHCVLKELEGTGGQVSVIDLVAYQIGWGMLLIDWYEQGLQGISPKMPGEGFTKWDYRGLAKHFYQKYGYSTIQQSVETFHTVVLRLLEIVEQEHYNGHLDKIDVWEWCRLKSGKEWPLSKWVIINTVSPYKRAAQLIRQYRKRNRA